MNTSLKKHLIYLSLKIQKVGEKTPNIVVKLNDTLCKCDKSTDDTIEFIMSGNFGNNLLTISLDNKSINDTAVDSDGNIIQDLNAQLLELNVDGISVIDYARQKNVYFTVDNSVENTYGFMHKNGTMSISIICPAFYMLRNQALVSSN